MSIQPVGQAAVQAAGQGSVLNGTSNEGYTRFRSFAERYVIERTSMFRFGHEKEDAWTAVLDARAIFGMIATADGYRQNDEAPQRLEVLQQLQLEVSKRALGVLADKILGK